ncbi:MAG: hypothetical protein HOV80_07700 [Polyangiaceae bacterium]|nr:hypothetical protein [Polyangiaceae bacterium]
MPAFDQLQPGSFDGIAFSVSRCNVKGGMADHVHKYPHSPGGKPELLGRQLYLITMEADFSTNLRNYPNAWPTDLAELRSRFEQGIRGDLHIPTIGTIRAYAVDWDQDFDARRRDGERARFVFREDQDAESLVEDTIAVDVRAVGPLADELMIVIEQEEIETDFFTAITQAANELTSIVDQVEFQADLLSAKASTLAAACRQIDESLDIIKQPPHWRVARAVRDLGAAAVEIEQDTLRRRAPMFIFEVPSVMSITDVARAMYADAGRAAELLLLNGIPDPYEIRPGFEIRGYLDKAA